MSRSRRRVGLGLALALVGTLLAGCSDNGGGDGAGDESALDLNGRSFVSQEVHGRTLVTGTTVSLSFDDDRISAEAGCNTMNGEATWTDGTLTVPGPLAMTRMACEKGLAAQDEWLSELLTSGPDIALEGDTLILGNDQKGITLTEGE